jgi:AcrR family transcriptional regulator
MKMAPPTAPADSTRDALLRAGRRLFAQHGYDATSIRALTRHAQANLGAVTYHFGSKRALYHNVLTQALEPFADHVVAATRRGATPLDRAASVVRAYFEVLREMPDVPFLLIQELAAGRTPPPPVRRALARVSGTLAELVAEGQADGSIRDGHPTLLALSIVAQPIHMSIVSKALSDVAGIDQSDAATREHVYTHTAEFVRAGLRAERSG